MSEIDEVMPPPGFRVKIAVLTNDKLSENVVVGYEYYTGRLSTTTSSRNVRDPEVVVVEMFDKLVKHYTGRYGFRVEIEGEQIY
jgi:hypothetical protein